MITKTQPAAVPKNTARNTGLIMATLIDYMAAMPWADGRRARALITETEKAKKRPAINPQPSAATSAMEKTKPSTIAIRLLDDYTPARLLSSVCFIAFKAC